MSDGKGDDLSRLQNLLVLLILNDRAKTNWQYWHSCVVQWSWKTLVTIPVIQDIHIIFWLNFNCVIFPFWIYVFLLQMQINISKIYQILKCVSKKYFMMHFWFYLTQKLLQMQHLLNFNISVYKISNVALKFGRKNLKCSVHFPHFGIYFEWKYGNKEDRTKFWNWHGNLIS